MPPGRSGNESTTDTARWHLDGGVGLGSFPGSLDGRRIWFASKTSGCMPWRVSAGERVWPKAGATMTLPTFIYFLCLLLMARLEDLETLLVQTDHPSELPVNIRSYHAHCPVMKFDFNCSIFCDCLDSERDEYSSGDYPMSLTSTGALWIPGQSLEGGM